MRDEVKAAVDWWLGWAAAHEFVLVGDRYEARPLYVAEMERYREALTRLLEERFRPLDDMPPGSVAPVLSPDMAPGSEVERAATEAGLLLEYGESWGALREPSVYCPPRTTMWLELGRVSVASSVPVTIYRANGEG